MQNFGEEGQIKLKRAKVAVVGLGCLGSAAFIYLTAAGICHICIIDDDIVELPDLNRQILYREKDLGKKKTEVAKNYLSLLNSEIRIEAINEKINKNNFKKLLEGIDAIVDCTDNFPTRYLLNEASLKFNIPLFHGACRGMEGIVTTILPMKTACLKCIFPEPPPQERFPILGAIAGTIGTIQATEVIKFFIGMPVLANKLLIYDAQFLRYNTVKLERNLNCPVCGVKNED